MDWMVLGCVALMLSVTIAVVMRRPRRRVPARSQMRLLVPNISPGYTPQRIGAESASQDASGASGDLLNPLNPIGLINPISPISILDHSSSFDHHSSPVFDHGSHSVFDGTGGSGGGFDGGSSGGGGSDGGW